MLAIVINLNIFAIAGIVIASALAGFLIRGNKSAALNKKVQQLEQEMLESHAEILQLQKEKIDILKSMSSEPTIPVIPINISKDEKSDKLPDGGVRKKLLNPQTPIKKQSGL